MRELRIIVCACTYLLACVTLCVSCSLLLDSLLFAPINVDGGGNYIVTGERLVEGYVPFKDLAFVYAPLGILLFGVVHLFLDAVQDKYIFHLGLTLLFEILTSLGVGVALRKSQVSMPLSVLGVGITMACLVFNEGDAVFLEPFVAFFSVAAGIMLLSNKNRSYRIFLGLCFSICAVLSKQYGLVAFLSFLLAISATTSWSKELKSFLTRSLGLFVLILTSCGLFLLLQGASPLVIHRFIPLGYLSRGSFHNLVTLVNFFWMFTPLALVGLFLVWEGGALKRSVLYFGLCMLGFSLTLWIRPFKHYLGLLIPFATLLSVLLVHRVQRANFIAGTVLTALLALPLYQIMGKTRWSVSQPEIRISQYAQGAMLNSYIPRGSKVLLYASPSIHHTAGFFPAAGDRYGFGFLSNLSRKQQIECVEDAEYIVVNRANQGYAGEPLKVFAGDENHVFESNDFFKDLVVDGTIEIWKRKA